MVYVFVSGFDTFLVFLTVIQLHSLPQSQPPRPTTKPNHRVVFGRTSLLFFILHHDIIKDYLLLQTQSSTQTVSFHSCDSRLVKDCGFQSICCQHLNHRAAQKHSVLVEFEWVDCLQVLSNGQTPLNFVIDSIIGAVTEIN